MLTLTPPDPPPVELPTTRIDSWKYYARIIEDARAQSNALLIEAERWLGRNDLFYLMVRLLRREDVDNDWLFARCREIEVARDGYLDLWSREHFKSSLITFGMTIQDILRNPELTVGIFSHTRPIAKTFLRQIKSELEQNTLLKHIYADVLYEDPRKESPKWSEDDGIIVKRVGNPKEATVEAWGLVDGQPTGRHFRLRVYDDVVTRESVTTAEQIQKTTLAWELSDNLGVAGGSVRYIGTRWALYDSYATIIMREAAIPRIYPATHNGRIDGRPVFFSDTEWSRRKKTYTRSTIASQLLQNPMADEAAMFRVQWLRAYEVRPRTLNVYILCDPSRGRSATSDNTAIAVIGVSSAGTKFLLDGLCHRMTLSQRWSNLRNLHKKWSKARGVQHLAVGYERYGAQSDDEYFQERMNSEKHFFTIQELAWPRDGTQSKRERVERLEPDFRNGRFFLPLPVYYQHKPSVWSVDTDPESKTFNDILYRDVGGLTSAQLDAVDGGSADLVARVIKSVDQDNHVYDLTLHFIDEYASFPFGERKDLVDACSRLYDMQYSTPVAPSELKEPEPYWDR